jgi:hypothetical protein
MDTALPPGTQGSARTLRPSRTVGTCTLRATKRTGSTCKNSWPYHTGSDAIQSSALSCAGQVVKLLLSVAMQTTQGIVLTQAAVDELRRRHVLLPPVLALEKLCATVATPAQGEMHRRLTATIEKWRSGVAIGLTFTGYFHAIKIWPGAAPRLNANLQRRGIF